MYPKVFTNYADARRHYGPVAALPTPIYFYGMQPGGEINVELERGKTLVIAMTAIGETEEDGTVRVFFELNGQPRIITVMDRKASASVAVRRVADSANESHIAAPMPGVVAALAVAQGQAVKAGDLLLTLEAMKMEAAVTAPKDSVVNAVFVKVGQSVQAKDLLIELVSS